MINSPSSSFSSSTTFVESRTRTRTITTLATTLWFVAWIGWSATAAETTNPPPAKLKVSGYGLLGDLRLKKMLGVLETGKRKPQFFNASFIEDAALLLGSRVRTDGYLRPVITAQVTRADGSEFSWVWRDSVGEPLPRPLRARKVHFKIKEGVHYHLQEIEFPGLEAIRRKKARGYFVETGGLFTLKQNRIYSPGKFKRGVDNLEEQLHRMGFRDARVQVAQLDQDDRSGRVRVRIEVVQGPKYIVRSVWQEVYFGSDTEPVDTRTNWPGQAYSKIWEQDYAQSLKTNYYHLGYPDTTVDLSTVATERGTNDNVLLDLRAVVRTGRMFYTGQIIFTGNRHTRTSVLQRRMSLHPGDVLDRLEAERSRYRLSRLGVFNSVQLRYHTVDEQTRDISYDLAEGKQLEVSLLFGYGSYELVRGGVQLDQFNVFGRAHHQQLKLVQSFKSSSADYTYTMPEFFGESVDLFLNASGLRREEVSFTRLEYGGGIGLRKYFRDSATDVSTRYNYSILRATAAPANFAREGAQNPGVGAIITDFNHDRRDNPLYPHRGYKLFGEAEIASEYLASDVNYQRLDLAASLHLPLSDSQWMHFGLSHGLVATVGSASQDLPFNRRFFPGGENSIRGYQEGEASPRNAAGKFVGAETYLLGNIEFEQGITPKWSVVTFADGLGSARKLKDYPLDQELFSVGGGLRWKTFIGPVRLEYGYNLNRRPGDPVGTLHFSLGFPF